MRDLAPALLVQVDIKTSMDRSFDQFVGSAREIIHTVYGRDMEL